MAEALGTEPKMKYLEERNEVVDAYADHSKAADVFGGSAQVDLPEGVGRMVEWAAKVGAKASEEFSNIEIPRNTPPSWKPKNS